MSSSSSYLYPSSRLSGEGQIRLLTIQPGAGESQEIQCELEIVHLEENPSYIALSYTWGPPTAEAADTGVTCSTTHVIRCSGDLIVITKNLHDFFQRVRCDPELILQRYWVDSVCINQQDAAERGSQVSFMASIYRSADMVIAWLGEEDNYTEESFTLIRTLGTLCEDCLKQIVPKNRGTENFVGILGPLADNRLWNSLRQFWQRSYFKRAWIIQELALAKKVIVKCGGRILDWNYIVRVSAFLALTPWTQCLNMGLHELGDRDYSNHALPLYLYSNSKMAILEKHCGLLYFLTKGRRFQCSDPRDKVYSLLGLLGDHIKGKPRLRPVYADRSVVDTYVFTAIEILEDADDLLLLAHVEGQDFQIVEGLPSWVPDWSCIRGLGLGIVGYKRFTAAANLPRTLKINEPNMSLALSGFHLDKVVQVGESKDEALFHRTLAYFPGWISMLSALPLVYNTGQVKTEVFWRTLITDTAARVHQSAQHPAADEYRQAFYDWLACIILRWRDEPPSTKKIGFLEELGRLTSSGEKELSLSTVDKPATDLPKNLLANSFNGLMDANNSNFPDADDYNTIINHSSQTRLLRTSANYLGLATTSVREGDSVWIVSGSRVPLILRETGQHNEYWLVGGAYVHGFMQGEALVSDAVLGDINIV